MTHLRHWPCTAATVLMPVSPPIKVLGWADKMLSIELLEADLRRRAFLGFVCGAAAWPLAATAQEAGRSYRVGCLFPSPRNAPQNIALFDELGRLGFIEGQNLAIDFRGYGEHVDLVSKFAVELANARVDVIVAGGDIAIRAAQAATATIPILGFTDDMVGSGLVNSLARSGGNTTGVSILATELDGKRQELLVEAVPGLRRMAALADTNTTASTQLQALRDAARISNVELAIRSPNRRRSWQPSMRRRHRVPRR
jgi:putative ABC transport system substrate-binding protein